MSTFRGFFLNLPIVCQCCTFLHVGSTRKWSNERCSCWVVCIYSVYTRNYKLIQRHFKNEITKTLGNIKNIENTLTQKCQYCVMSWYMNSYNLKSAKLQ